MTVTSPQAAPTAQAAHVLRIQGGGGVLGTGTPGSADGGEVQLRTLAGIGTNANGGDVHFALGAGVGTGRTGVAILDSVSTHADNTAALAAGLPVGAVYRTAAGVMMIVF